MHSLYKLWKLILSPKVHRTIIISYVIIIIIIIIIVIITALQLP